MKKLAYTDLWFKIVSKCELLCYFVKFYMKTAIYY